MDDAALARLIARKQWVDDRKTLGLTAADKITADTFTQDTGVFYASLREKKTAPNFASRQDAKNAKEHAYCRRTIRLRQAGPMVSDLNRSALPALPAAAWLGAIFNLVRLRTSCGRGR